MTGRFAKALAALIALSLPLALGGEVEKILQVPPPKPDISINFAGEQLRYEASWMGITAGEAVLSTTEFNGHYKIEAASHSTGRARYLYKMDDAARAETQKDFTPIFYDLQIREPRFRHDRLMWIDRNQKTAQVKIVQADSGQVKEKFFGFYQGMDPVSLTFLVRTLYWKPGMRQYFEILDGRDRSIILLEAGPVQTITTRAGSFRAIRIQPSLFNLPKKPKNETRQTLADILNKKTVPGIADWVYFWLALDGNRPIVLAKAYSLIGPVALELVSNSPPRYCPAGPGK